MFADHQTLDFLLKLINFRVNEIMVVDGGRSFIFDIENQNFSPSNILEILRGKSDLRDQPLGPGSGSPIFSLDLYDRESAPPIRRLDVQHNCGR